MNPWLILALVVYPVMEWFAASWLATYIGWGGVLLVVAVLVIVGAAVMRRAGFAAARSLRPVEVDGATVMPGATSDALSRAGREVGDAGTLFVAGLLIAIPGLITSLVGLVLLIPPVRRLARAGAARFLRRRADAAGIVFDSRAANITVVGDVVPGTVVREDTPSSDQRQIISGEVITPAPDDEGDRPSS